MTAIGAERKAVTLPTDFRSPSYNGHSRYSHPTARFAPNRTFGTRKSIPSGAAVRSTLTEHLSVTVRPRALGLGPRGRQKSPPLARYLKAVPASCPEEG